MKAYVYILRDARGKFYVGSTSNVARRLEQHRSGSTRTTKFMRNPELVLIQEYDSLRRARAAERRVKALKRKDYIEKMVTEGYIKVAP